jgi:hypothetical protein
MVKYKVLIKAGSIFHHHSRRNNMNNLQIDEDIEVELDEGVEILMTNGNFRLGNYSNNNLPNVLYNIFNTRPIILKKDTKYINTNTSEDLLGFTKRLELEQEVYFNCGTRIEIPEGTPMQSICGNLKFLLTSPITGHVS